MAVIVRTRVDARPLVARAEMGAGPRPTTRRGIPTRRHTRIRRQGGDTGLTPTRFVAELGGETAEITLPFSAPSQVLIDIGDVPDSIFADGFQGS